MPRVHRFAGLQLENFPGHAKLAAALCGDGLQNQRVKPSFF